jgi:hypothetical protein
LARESLFFNALPRSFAAACNLAHLEFGGLAVHEKLFETISAHNMPSKFSSVVFE